jgi:flavin-dependent dehydrogenase
MIFVKKSEYGGGKMWDVIVIGGGPGGAMAAKKCAEENLKTLILEKKKLPRNKVCTGMIMSPMAQNTIKQEFGEIPMEVLTTPNSLIGIWCHLSRDESYKIRVGMPLTWRRDLDYWLIEKARQAGAHVWERSKVTHITEKPEGYLIKLIQENGEIETKGKFIIGADGAGSIVRESLFPQLNVKYALGYQECYKVDLGLDKNHWHLFLMPEFAPSYFSIIHKEEFMLIDLAARKKELKKLLLKQAHHTLEKTYGFEVEQKPLWHDACIEPVLYHELFSGSFLPAKGNGLLVGDAAGLLLPISGEGIGAALKSGLLAADSVIEANRKNRQASDIYLDQLRGLTSKLQELYSDAKKMFAQEDQNQRVSILKEAWEKALRLR